MRLPSRTMLIIGAILVVLLAGGGIFFAIHQNTAGKPVAAVTPSPSPTNTLFYPNAGPVAAKAIKKLETAPKSVLTADALAKYGNSLNKAIPAGSTLTPQPKTWSPDGVGGGSMLTILTRADGSKQAFIVLMIKQRGQWKIESTYTNTDAGQR